MTWGRDWGNSRGGVLLAMEECGAFRTSEAQERLLLGRLRSGFMEVVVLMLGCTEDESAEIDIGDSNRSWAKASEDRRCLISLHVRRQVGMVMSFGGNHVNASAGH